MPRPVLTEGDCFIIDKVLSERIATDPDEIFTRAVAETLARLRAIVAEKKARG